MKRVPLSQGYYALVDDRDYRRVSQFKWSVWHPKRNTDKYTPYAFRTINKPNGSRSMQRLHRFILGVADPRVKVDHEDGNGLNNRRKNIRRATPSQNGYNKKNQSNNTSGFKGVDWIAPMNKWRVRITAARKTITVGFYSSKAAAGRARAKAARKYHGRFARVI